MKVFISGPMTGIEDNNSPAFYEAEELLIIKGYDVFNPAWMRYSIAWTREECMAIDIVALGVCDAIYQLDGWEASLGARIEYRFAKDNGKIFLNRSDICDTKRIQEN